MNTLAVLVDNEAGVLSRVVRLFSGKGYNIESLAVGTTDDPAISRITIEILASEDQTHLISSQLRKLICVHSVKTLNAEHAIRRELVLIKVSAATSESKAEAIQNLLREFGILELVRTGMVALERGQFTIDEQTKVKGEYDYGKNVL